MNTTAQFMVSAVIIGMTFNVCIAKESTDSVTVDPMLVALNRYRPVLNVVKKYYPNATSILFEKKLHFEDSTQLYVARAIAKVPAGKEPPLVEVRGPQQKGGVWCNIILSQGSSKRNARAEGAVDREGFVEHIIYQDLHETDMHLRVTLRVPKGDGSADFVKAFTKLIRSYSHDFVKDK